MQRTIKDYFVITLKGLAMGAADVVPGVSGGTIAFISGIYEELITSINQVNLSALKTLRKEGIKKAWLQINGNFFLALFIGIAISIVSLAKVLKWLLDEHPISLWSFFFGLIAASILFIGKQIGKWEVKTILALAVGTAIAYYITVVPASSDNGAYWFLFLSGALAICAMILPGISGAFILVLLGSYSTVLGALSGWNLKILAIVGLGAIIGLLSFSRVLKWLFKNYENPTLALLTGFMLGSLNKIWPWKETLSWRTNSHGAEVPLMQNSISPFSFDGEPRLLMAIGLATLGFLTIFILERTAKKTAN